MLTDAAGAGTRPCHAELDALAAAGPQLRLVDGTVLDRSAHGRAVEWLTRSAGADLEVARWAIETWATTLGISFVASPAPPDRRDETARTDATDSGARRPEAPRLPIRLWPVLAGIVLVVALGAVLATIGDESDESPTDAAPATTTSPGATATSDTTAPGTGTSSSTTLPRITPTVLLPEDDTTSVAMRGLFTADDDPATECSYVGLPAPAAEGAAVSYTCYIGDIRMRFTLYESIAAATSSYQEPTTGASDVAVDQWKLFASMDALTGSTVEYLVPAGFEPPDDAVMLWSYDSLASPVDDQDLLRRTVVTATRPGGDRAALNAWWASTGCRLTQAIADAVLAQG